MSTRETWYEDGYEWTEDRRGNLFWKDGKRWRRLQRPGVWQAAGEAMGDAAAVTWLNAQIAYALVRKLKNI